MYYIYMQGAKESLAVTTSAPPELLKLNLKTYNTRYAVCVCVCVCVCVRTQI